MSWSELTLKKRDSSAFAKQQFRRNYKKISQKLVQHTSNVISCLVCLSCVPITTTVYLNNSN